MTDGSFSTALPSGDKMEDLDSGKEAAVRADAILVSSSDNGDDATQLPDAHVASSAAMKWSYRRKILTVVLVSAMTTVDTFATLITVPAVPKILQEFNSDDQAYLALLVTIWELGEAAGPFFIAPLSERFGRLPVYHTCNALFLVCSVGGALSNSLKLLVALRFLNGLFVASLTLGPAMVGDMFEPKERGSAMAALYMGPLLGPILGPIVGGSLAQAAGWRWTYWFIVIAVAVVQIPSFIFMRETSAGHLARADQSGTVQSRKPGEVLRTAIIKPLRFLKSPAFLIAALYVAITYGYFFVVLTTLTPALEGIYGFSTRSAGLAFLAPAVGMVLGVVACGATSDLYLKSKGSKAAPEHRLIHAVIASLLLPVGLFWYSWTLRAGIPWIVPLLGTSLTGIGIMAIAVQGESFLVDAYAANSATAVGVAASLRGIAGAVLPLAGPPLYDALGYGWGGSVLGFIALALAPALFLLMRHGVSMRKRWPVAL